MNEVNLNMQMNIVVMNNMKLKMLSQAAEYVKSRTVLEDLEAVLDEINANFLEEHDDKRLNPREVHSYIMLTFRDIADDLVPNMKWC